MLKVGCRLKKEFRRVRNQVIWKLETMDTVFESYLLTSELTDFPIVDVIWIFGRSYSIHYDLEELRRSIATCIWVTYRKNFPSIAETHMTSDRGWGCMIRCGQMLTAKALLLRHLGPQWHWDPQNRDHGYLHIVSLFEDHRNAPLSIHQIASNGAALGKPIGSWLGPNTVIQAIKKIVLSEPTLDLHVHVAMDSIIVKSEVKCQCLTANQPHTHKAVPGRLDQNWKPLLLVVPLRLGLSELNPVYIPGLKAVFEVPQNVGIMGGRPNHALYFLGYAENEVLYLDPHTVQPAVTIGSKIYSTEEAADETYHIQKPGRMNFLAMDPSVAVCFYVSSEADFDSLCTKLSDRFSSSLGLFEICESRGNFGATSTTSTTSTTTSTSFAPGEEEEEGFEILG